MEQAFVREQYERCCLVLPSIHSDADMQQQKKTAKPRHRHGPRGGLSPGGVAGVHAEPFALAAVPAPAWAEAPGAGEGVHF